MTAPVDSRSAAVRLCLLLPVPSLGVCAGMLWWPGTSVGAAVFSICKVWLLLFPLICRLAVDRQPISFSPARRGGLWQGAILGVLISVAIAGVYVVWGARFVDAELLRARMRDIGLDRLHLYIACALYWITVNSLLEEYVWRWFVVREFEKLAGSVLAVFLSALAFTVHHVIALRVYLDWESVVPAAAGIFAGGILWSACYVRYRSIWPGYISHAIVDIAVFGVGYHLIFLQA